MYSHSVSAEVHKQHHEYKQTIGIASTYAHPVRIFQELVTHTAIADSSAQLEDLLANGLPTAIGAIVIGARTSATCQSALICVTPDLTH